MTKKTVIESALMKPHPRQLHAPTYYADQAAGLMLGPGICRLTFGQIDGNDDRFPTPVVTIAMPTQSLMELVHDLKKLFDDPEFRTDAAAALMEAAKEVAAGGKPTPDQKLITTTLPKQAKLTGPKRAVRKIAGN